MAKKNKSKKIEKETRKIIEALSDMVKKTDDGGFKIKAKKKDVKRIKRTCPHWIIRKGKESPTVIPNPEKDGEWKCTICGATFPISPLEPEEYDAVCKAFLQIVNQGFFYSVRMGGDSSDTRLFEMFKRSMPRFNKVIKNEMKQLNKKANYERQRKEEMNDLNQFNAYGSIRFNG